MSLIPVAPQYTDKDFDALRLRLQSLVRSVFPDWTDFNVANFGNILLESFAFVGDVLTFYQDNQALESRIVTATQRKNLIALTKLIGFKPAGAQAATADEVFALAAVPGNDVLISAGTVVSTAAVTEPVAFQLLADVLIAAGADPPQGVGTIENSESQQEILASTGLANQEIRLLATPFLEGSALINAANGTYAQVDNFLSSGPTDRHFTVTVDQNDRATVRFGNGVNGAIPSGTITMDYKTGGGSVGNVEPGTITSISGSFTDILGNPVTLSVTNPNRASGGVDRQTVAQIKTLAPESIRVANRSVAREDFEINARRVSAVARALMLTSNEDPGIAENSGILFIIPQGGGLPSQALKDEVFAKIDQDYPPTLTFDLEVQDPVFLPIDVDVTVFLRQGTGAAAVATTIRKTLQDFFAVSLADGTPNPNVDFGFNIKDVTGEPAGEIPWSDVFDVIRDTSGVRKIEPSELLLNGLNDDVPIGVREFPSLGNVRIIDGDTGNPI